MAQKTIENIVFIGSGNVATNLAKAFQLKGKNILQIYSRTENAAKILAQSLRTSYTNDISKINPAADLYILSINDDALPELTKLLQIQDALLVHTSGSTSMEILKESSNNYGVFYPLLSFKKDFFPDFSEIPILIEGNTSATQEKLCSLANEISDYIYCINSEQRKWIHIAAVFACNFSNFMSVIADDILSKQEIPFAILHPLLKQMYQRLETTAPLELQTGPAVRNDHHILQNHLECLQNEPEYQKIYELISQAIIAKIKK